MSSDKVFDEDLHEELPSELPTILAEPQSQAITEMNKKLEDYMQKILFLEAKNRRLMGEFNDLKSQSPK
uniref:CCDC92 domain-containing protein n=1 Tax=Rhabditophanes sp. KR3021 TaxID=114890 RepID=A0AC35TVC1_9BILA